MNTVATSILISQCCVQTAAIKPKYCTAASIIYTSSRIGSDPAHGENSEGSETVGWRWKKPPKTVLHEDPYKFA
jgi:hypothetical protein